jgi:hypothetical protein
MKATSIKQIKFNRGQVSDLLSERMDMGLQNACGTVYDNIYINRYGQLQNSPVPVLCCQSPLGLYERILCMFDSGNDAVYPIVLGLTQDGQSQEIKVFGPLSRTNPIKYFPGFGASKMYQQIDFSSPIASQALTMTVNKKAKVLQFGYNILIYGQSQKPFLLNLVPQSGHEDWDTNVTLTVKENYFDGSFDNVYVRGLNTVVPTGFTVPTSGQYIIPDKQITTKLIVTVKRNGAGGNFTQDLVGQVLHSPANGGVLQVRGVIDADTLTAYVLSPFVALSATASDIRIPWDNKYDTEWVFGYEKAYGDTQSPYGSYSYPDSATYVNQRLVFGGNDYHGSLISASRIGVINDFDPESGTESDAFTTSISAKDFCRIVDFVVSNNELRIACTNGEYAMSLANLTPSGSLNGFDLRSEVGIAKDTAICDCGGLTAYTSWARDAVYGTQFSLLKDRYQPISLTSQTSNMVKDCSQLEYITNRKNNEGNCLLGLNGDRSIFVGGIDLNAGLINISKIKKLGTSYNLTDGLGRNIQLLKLFTVGDAVWGEIAFRFSNITQDYYERFLVRFVFGEMFAFPAWYNYYPSGSIIPGTETHPNELVLPTIFGVIAAQGYEDLEFRALYKNPDNKYEIINPTGYTNNNDGTYTVNFADDIDQTNIVTAGFVRQSDWRSVEIGMGMATRELNKYIIKLEGVIEPTQVTAVGRFAELVLTPEESKDFITLIRSKDVETMDVDNLGNTSYTEQQDMIWRRAFDNPDRELHYGVSMIAPFLVKSLTATVQYDEIA